MGSSKMVNRYWNNSPKNKIMAVIDLAARYAAAFGAMAVGRYLDKVQVSEKAQNDYSFDYFPSSGSEHEYVKLEIPGSSLEFSSVMFGSQGAIFAPPLMLNFSVEKSLIETEVNDDDAIIVERWGTMPWNIQIRGILIDLENRIYPSSEIRRLNQNWRYNGVVKAIGQQFEEKDIDSIYYRSLEFTGVEGFQDTIQFSMNAKSIKGVNFTLLKANT
jgi:hypothetical protein